MSKLAAAIAAGAALIAVTLGGAAAGAADRDCSDFPTQAAAQQWFDAHGPGDPANLDADGDGIACESNPCPCVNPGGDDGGGGQVGEGTRLLAVVDGDTIKVRLRGRVRDVRLIGIDTPEVYGGVECGGRRASRSMKRMLDRGDPAKLLRDRSQDNRDRYGRLLRYATLRGRDVGRRQIRKGWAKPYVYETPFVRLRSYRRAKLKAKRHNRGVWRRCGGDFHHRRWRRVAARAAAVSTGARLHTGPAGSAAATTGGSPP